MLVKLDDVYLDKLLDHIAVLVQAWEIRLEDISQFEFLNESNEHPECHLLIAMVQHRPHNEVHSLDITYIGE